MQDSKPRAATAVLLFAAALVALLIFSPVSPLAQKVSQPGSEGNLLPSRTGEPLTLKPIDLPDIQCSVADWKNTAPKPVLTLLCPPQEVFAPLRVYLKLSWLKPEDVPGNSANILAPPKTPTKLRTNKGGALVWLNFDPAAKEKPQAQWVQFNGVVDVALLAEPRNR